MAILTVGIGQEAAITASPTAISFGSGNTVGTTTYDVWALVSGDLDNDGDADLVSADRSIRAWRNDDPFVGTWSSQTVGNPAIPLWSLAIGDLDNDGDLDVASGSTSSTGYEILVWQNDGTPFDSEWTPNDAGETGTRLFAIAMGDLDNDGDLDIVSGGNDGQVIAWRNDGTPFSGVWASNSMGTVPGPDWIRALAVGDLDDDGDLDVVSGDRDYQVVAWENDGTPFSDAWSSQAVYTADDEIESLALEDLDGDGDLEVVAACHDGEDYEVTAWRNDGAPFSGTWTQQIEIGALNVNAYAVVVADFDVEGDPDVASGSLQDATAAELRVWENDAGTWSGADVGETGAIVYALTVADLDRDGDPDLASTAGVEIITWPNTRPPEVLGNWTEGPQPLPTDEALSVALADCDHDGKLDIAAGTIEEGVHVWLGGGPYTWTPVGASDLPPTGTWTGVAWGQINNQREMDLAAASEGDGLRAWRVEEYGKYWDDISTGLPTSGYYQDLALGHVDHDGLLDLAACGKGLGARVWEGGGDSWGLQKVLSGTLDFCDVALGHVDHDGNLDIVVANCSGSGSGLPVWLGEGGFGFNEAPSPTTTGSYEVVALGDLDNDGDTDLIAAPQTGGVEVWLGDGGTAWAYEGAISPTLTVLSLDLGDFDNDGYMDILAGLYEAGVRVWKGDGGTSWTDASTNLATANHYYGVALGRVDGDAALDVVGAESGGSGVRVWTAVEPPPGGWANFTPYPAPLLSSSYWVHTQTVTCTVQVVDTSSGLDVSTAEYRFSRDGGTSWVGGWLTAECSGSDGVTTTQVITASSVPFNQDSETQNAIQFRIVDLEGYTGTSQEYYVAIDSTPPWNPSDLGSTSHTVDEWSDDASVRFEWHDMDSDALSGVSAFSWVFNQVISERPDEEPEQEGGTWGYTIEYATAADGDWYLHFMTRDRAGNWSEPAHLGPYRIDTNPPTTPTLTSSSHTVGGWSNDATISVRWDSSDGGGSGVAGYSYVWDDHPSRWVDLDIDTTDNFTTSSPLADDQWYLHVRAIDQGGSASPIAHLGPFGVDTADPYECRINVPAFCARSSCPVEWLYLDDTSGVASYDVQVWEPMDLDWDDWLMGTTSTSAVYTDAYRLGTYSFHVRARDRADNLTGYDCQDQTVMEDLEVTGLEVTQGMQNLANEMPLIRDKETYVRVYVDSEWVDVPGVDARLYGTRDGSPLPGSPLLPTRGHITVRADGGDRDNLDDAFYFELPPDWRSGTVEFRAVVDPAHTVPEDDYTDNERLETVTFHRVKPVQIRMVRAHVHPRSSSIDDPGFEDIVEAFRRIWPIDEVDIVRGGIIFPQWHGGPTAHWAEWNISDDMNWVLAEVGWYALWDGSLTAVVERSSRHWYAMVHPSSWTSGDTAGIAYCFPSTEIVAQSAAGIMQLDRSTDHSWSYPAGGFTLAHELLHNRTQQHADCTGTEVDGGGLDPDWPYGGVDPGCRIAEDGSDSYYGFFMPIGSTTPEVITPTEATALMSYGRPRWISEYNYRFLFEEFTSRMASHVPQPEAAPQADEYLAVSGIVTPSLGTGSLGRAYRLTDINPQLPATSSQDATAQTDQFSLVLEDAGGHILYTHPFSLSQSYPNGALQHFFLELLPYDPQTAHIVLRQGNTELAERTVSSHAPTVTLLSPNGGETFADTMTISWSGSDADGDELFYSLQYSPDNGQTWQAITVNRPETSFNLDTLDFLPGSDEALIRVIVTDGVNTGMDQSDAVFSVARHSPDAYITEPWSGSTYNTGETVKLRGFGLDTEDGTLGPAALTWTSSLSGTLGAGTELWVSNLTTGTHRITLTTTDSDGDTGTDEIIIFVGIPPNKIYLPIVLRDYAS